MTWLMHVCDMTSSYVWHDAFTCVTRLSLKCVAWLVHVRQDSFISNMSRSDVTWHDSFICDMTRLIHTWHDTTHLYVTWHDSFIREQWMPHSLWQASDSFRCAWYRSYQIKHHKITHHKITHHKITHHNQVSGDGDAGVHTKLVTWCILIWHDSTRAFRHICHNIGGWRLWRGGRELSRLIKPLEYVTWVVIHWDVNELPFIQMCMPRSNECVQCRALLRI